MVKVSLSVSYAAVVTYLNKDQATELRDAIDAELAASGVILGRAGNPARQEGR